MGRQPITQRLPLLSFQSASFNPGGLSKKAVAFHFGGMRHRSESRKWWSRRLVIDDWNMGTEGPLCCIS